VDNGGLVMFLTFLALVLVAVFWAFLIFHPPGRW
jgi:hypothetical protein